MKPRLFWTRVYVRHPSGREETWYTTARADRNDAGVYQVEVTIDRYREKTAEELAVQPLMNQKVYAVDRYRVDIWKDEAHFAGRNWTVGWEAADPLIGSVDAHDGNDFPSLAAAVWMCMEKFVERRLTNYTSALGKVVWTRVNPKDHICNYGARRSGIAAEARFQLVSY